MGRKKSVRDADVKGRRVLVRVDFNVPLERGQITDDSRIRAALPTIRYLLDHRAAVVLMSHLGRPKGRVVPELSLRPVAERTSELLGTEVRLAPDVTEEGVRALIKSHRPGEAVLLENLRFRPEEEKNDPHFAEQLAELGDLYVNDAFGAAHRAHASTVGVTHYLPAVSGFLMERELEALGGVLENAAYPLIAVIGGAKISSKIGVLEHLLRVAEGFVIGGGMANTLLKAEGVDVQASLVEDDKLETARRFLAAARRRERSVYLPTDVVVAPEVAPGVESKTVPLDGIPDGWKIVDIGPESERQFAGVIASAGTVVWNGPMGVFEIPEFGHGTRAVAEAMAASSAKTIVGGGDSVAALEQVHMVDRMSHVSTGGGASLEFLEGKELPGVAALNDAQERGG